MSAGHLSCFSSQAAADDFSSENVRAWGAHRSPAVKAPGTEASPRSLANNPNVVHFKNLTVKNSGPRGIISYNPGARLSVNGE